MKAIDVDQLQFKDWPLPENWLTEIGRIATLWSSLEGHLDLCLGKLAGFDSLGDFRPFVLLRHSSFPQKLDALSALCGALAIEFPNLTDYKPVVALLRTAQSGRNKFMHG